MVTKGSGEGMALCANVGFMWVGITILCITELYGTLVISMSIYRKWAISMSVYRTWAISMRVTKRGLVSQATTFISTA